MTYAVTIEETTYPVTVSGDDSTVVITTTVGGSAQEYMGFARRADFVAWAAGKTLPEGYTMDAGGFRYRFIGSGTAIPDLPGWIPLGQIQPDHWGENSVQGVTGMRAAIMAADAHIAATGGVLVFEADTYLWDGAGTKSDKTAWMGQMTNPAAGGVGTMIKMAHNGACITMTGSNVNYQGGVQEIRFLGDKALYPDLIAIDMEAVNDHFFENTYFGNMKIGVRGHNCKTCNFNWFYGFGMSEKSVYLWGDTPDKNTDHCFLECQFAGDLYGLHVEKGAAISVNKCRPQVSGVANAFFDTVNNLTYNGGFNDSAINGLGGAGDAIVLRNCDDVQIIGVSFYSNGAGAADIRVIADNHSSSDFVLMGNMHKIGTSGTRTAVAFDAPIGTGDIRRVGIHACNMVGMTTAIANPQNVSNELRVSECHGVPEYVGVSAPVANISYPFHAKVCRITGTLGTSFDVTVPNARSYAGDKVQLVRVNAGAGVVTFKGPDGAVIGTLAAPGSITAVAITSPTPPTPAAYVAI